MKKLPRIHVPMLKPEDVIPHLGSPTHWKQGRSAKSVADSWFRANDIPASVRAVLDQAPEYRGAELVDAWLERCVDLGDGGRPTQTDLMAVLAIGDGLAVLAVEAKVNESFGPTVDEWLLDASDAKRARLQMLCGLFGLDPQTVGSLRYQFLHRTASAILEARRYRAKCAVMLVQSFCPDHSGLADFKTVLRRGWYDRDRRRPGQQLEGDVRLVPEGGVGRRPCPVGGKERCRMNYYVYENWVRDKAIVHRGSCSFCREGQGLHGTPVTKSSKWHGPFPSSAMASAKARSLRKTRTEGCRICDPA